MIRGIWLPAAFVVLFRLLSQPQGSFDQTATDVQELRPGNPLERELAEGESHTYRITLKAGQLLRIVADQKGRDVALGLIAPDGTPLLDVDVSAVVGGREPLSYEAVAAGQYRLAIRASGPDTRTGPYQLSVGLHPSSSDADRQRQAAEQLLVDVSALRRQGKHTDPQVVEKLEKALSIWRELQDPYWEADTFNRLGITYSAAREHAKARDSFEQAVQIYRDVKNRAGEGNALYNLANANNSLTRHETALEQYEQALKILREVKNRGGEGNALFGLGNASNSLARHERAVEYYHQALPIVREVKNRAIEGSVLHNAGNVHVALGHYDKAIDYYEQAVPIHREVNNRVYEGNALSALGRAYAAMNRRTKSLEYYEQALHIHREVKNRASEAAALSNLGGAYLNLARYEKGIEYYEQALPIFRELKDRAAEGRTLAALGVGYTSMSRYERKAFEYLEQALQISRDVKNRSGEAFALMSLGTGYRLVSRYDKAIEYYQRALQIHVESKNRGGEATVLNNLGNIYRLMGRPEEGVKSHQRSLQLYREVKSRTGEVTSLYSLGHSYYALARYDEALDCYNRALPIAREIEDPEAEGIALNRVGMIQRMLGRPRDAVPYHLHALQIMRDAKIALNEGRILYELMLDWKALARPQLAIYYGKGSINVHQNIRTGLRSLDEGSQQSFVKDKEEIYRDVADLLITEGRLPEAEQVINLLKQEEYFDFIQRDQANAPQAGTTRLTPEEAALDKRHREITDQLAALGAERGALLDKRSRTAEEDQRLARLEADLAVGSSAFQKFLDQLTLELNAVKAGGDKMFQVRESQGLMEDLRELGEGVVAVYTLVGDDKYRVILTTPDFQKGFEYPIKGTDLNRKVLEFRSVVQNPKLDPVPLAQDLYKILVGPMAADLTATKAVTVMWSLDGVLRYLPIAALHDGQQYFVERYRNVIFTPASQARLKDRPSRQWRALGLGVTKAHGERIPALPAVAAEMRGIIRDAADGASGGVLPGTIKLDEAFTQDAMLAGLRQRPSVVHVASHFQFQPGNETDSALLLGDGSFLTLAQIKTLPNVFGGVELLTLSACNTATGGSASNGKEVEGFGVLAQRQGAKSVVASLWPVADTSTKELMQAFYRAREAQGGVSKADALRRAQLKLLRGEIKGAPDRGGNRLLVQDAQAAPAITAPPFAGNPKRPYAHPYYWAPFIMIGNWQ